MRKNRRPRALARSSSACDAVFIIERVDFVRGDQLRLGREIRSEQFQLAADDVHVRDRIPARHARHVHEVDEHFGAFEMAEELVSESLALVRALDQPGHVRDNEAAIVAQTDDTEVRRERGERVVGNLRARR